MCSDILTVGLKRPFWNVFVKTIEVKNIHIASVPSLDIASQLLAHRRFKVALVDLELFAKITVSFLDEAYKQRLYIIVMGNAGYTYSWPIEREADQFLSYKTSIPQLATYITEMLSPCKDHYVCRSGSRQRISCGGAI